MSCASQLEEGQVDPERRATFVSCYLKTKSEKDSGDKPNSAEQALPDTQQNNLENIVEGDGDGDNNKDEQIDIKEEELQNAIV